MFSLHLFVIIFVILGKYKFKFTFYNKFPLNLVCIQLISNESNLMIGNYSQVISDYHLCGYSKTTIRAEKTCLKYSQSLVPIIGGRDASRGEAPWVVYIASKMELLNM